MKIGLRGGHSPNCIGAVGMLNEYYECQKIYKRTAELLRAAGHTVIDCNSNAGNAGAELSEGTNKANANSVDFFASIHMNAGGGTGCEVWAYNSSSTKAIKIGSRICSNISSQIGIANRGMKYNTGYHDLRCTSCQSIIIETIFCDSNNDCGKYDVEKLSRAIANGIDNNIALEEPKTPVYHVDEVIIYNDGKEADEEIANTMNMILCANGHDSHVLSANDYATNKYGDFWGKKVILIGGSLEGRFNCDKLISGADRNLTAFEMYKYLLELGI